MKVAVLVDLYLSKTSGGHVKYWQRISESLNECKKKKFDNLKITIFFLGNKEKVEKINQYVNYQIVKPILPSKYLKFLGIDADSTDLFFFNPWLFFMLKDFDIIHTTDQFFSMMKTGSFASKFWKIPMTTSIHTDTPPYTKYYVSKIIKNLNFFGIDKVLINKLKIPEFFERKMFAKIYKYIKLSKHAFVADKIYSPEFVIQKTNNKNVTKLNRGINVNIFNSNKDNDGSIYKKFNIPQKDKLLFFSGRIHELKGAILLSNIHRRLNNNGIATTTIMAGENIHGKDCQKIAGKKLMLIGYLNQNELASIYRACDLFVFPSDFEIGPNVVLEAKACGAICVVSPNGGGKRIKCSGYDGVIIKNNDLDLWVTKISYLLQNNGTIQKMKNNLKSHKNIQSWKNIFELEIFPHWKKVIKSSL